MTSSGPERARLEISPTSRMVEPFASFVAEYGRSVAADAKAVVPLTRACRALLELVLARQEGLHRPEAIAIELHRRDGTLVVAIANRGLPVLPAAGSAGPDPLLDGFQSLLAGVDDFSIENLGREGQILRLEKRVGRPFITPAPLDDRADAAELEGEIQIRSLRPGEENGLVELFYRVYGYDYINETVYYPERVRQWVDSGKLLSIVAAAPGGRLIGHVGLVRFGDDHPGLEPVYEAALGLVDPEVKSRGLFGRIFARTMEVVKLTPMRYCFFDFVTNHDYSQREIGRYGTADLAIHVGCQRSTTQAKLERLGIGADPKETDRYSLLVSIIPRVEAPFGREVELPPSIGEPLGFLLEPLGLAWTPASRFDVLPARGRQRTVLQPQQDAVVFDLLEPGRDAVDEIVSTWQRLVRTGYRHAAIEVPTGTPGLGSVREIALQEGFFLSGFTPYRHGATLAARFQSLGPARVDFDEIRVASPQARRLLAAIREDHERTVHR